MFIDYNKLIVSMGILLAIIIGIVVMQIFLSKRKSKWLGMIIPILVFMFAGVIWHSVLTADKADPSMGYLIFVMTNIALVITLFDVILTVIYFVCRKKMRKKDNSTTCDKISKN